MRNLKSLIAALPLLLLGGCGSFIGSTEFYDTFVGLHRHVTKNHAAFDSSRIDDQSRYVKESDYSGVRDEYLLFQFSTFDPASNMRLSTYFRFPRRPGLGDSLTFVGSGYMGSEPVSLSNYSMGGNAIIKSYRANIVGIPYAGTEAEVRAQLKRQWYSSNASYASNASYDLVDRFAFRYQVTWSWSTMTDTTVVRDTLEGELHLQHVAVKDRCCSE